MSTYVEIPVREYQQMLVLASIRAYQNGQTDGLKGVDIDPLRFYNSVIQQSYVDGWVSTGPLDKIAKDVQS